MSWVLSKDICASRTASDWVFSMEHSPTGMDCSIGSPLCYQSCQEAYSSMSSSPWASASEKDLLLCGLSRICSILQASRSYGTQPCPVVWWVGDKRNFPMCPTQGIPRFSSPLPGPDRGRPGHLHPIKEVRNQYAY